MEYPECSVMWRWIWGLLCLCVIQWCWLSGISVANITPNKNCVWSPNCTGLSLALFCLCCVLMAGCHIQPHFKMSVLPLCASLWLNVSCSRCFFSFFFFSRLAGETVFAPPCGLKFCTQSFLVKVPAPKGRDFSLFCSGNTGAVAPPPPPPHLPP